MSQGAAKERLRPFKPQRFGRYTLLRPLSTGGMGEIFLARLEGAQGFEKLCVIKKILPHLAQDKDFVDRFVDEARILVKLSHGNIAQVLDMGLHDGAPYIALEFIDGKDLRRVVARAQERALQLPLSFILYVTTRLLDALAYAHRKRGDDGKELNLVHRDVSPQNILISYEGEVKVIDFGLAKSALSSTRTHPSIVLGKFLYMSPEQARHQTVDRRSDLYAVGLCLYELIAGKGPFDGVSPGELMATVANPKILPLSQAEPLCPPALSEVVMKALAADPAQRFQTAEELRGRLLTILLEIDPSAGPETATRFMTEAFATEYQGERKLLADLSEQARALGDGPHVPEEETLDPSNRSVTREVAAMPALTLDEVPQARVTAPEVKASPEVKTALEPALAVDKSPTPQALSFQPTRKAPAPSSKPPPEAVGTLPSIVVADAKMTDVVAAIEAEQSSVVLDDGLSEQADARARTLPETRPSKPGSAAVTKQETRKAAARTTGTGLKAQTRSTNPKVEKTDVKKAPARATPDDAPALDSSRTPDQTPAMTPTPMASPKVEPKKSGSSVLVWLAVPLLAIGAVGGYIAWDQYTEKLQAQQQGAANEPLPVPIANTPREPERSREVKLTPDPVEPAPTQLEPEDLAGVAKGPKKPTPKPVALPAGELALRKLEADLNQLDDAVARKFTLKVQVLKNDVKAQGADATFIARVNEVHNLVKAELAKQ
ncbi:MAG: protein kinase [Archangium sp.]|nr:protein kinase [Archangium sp.]